MTPQLLLLNTIGLTGVELLLSELARYPEIMALPGQNFSMFEYNLYRPHEYSGYSPERVFDSLARHLYTKEGRIWMGLTKHMSEDERNAYAVDRHKELFIDRLGASRDYLDALETYIETFYESANIPRPDARYLAFFSNNVLLNHEYYPGFTERVKVIDVSCRIDRWLTIISQTRTWNCAEACKFWLLNSLYAFHYGRLNGNYLAIESNEFADTPAAVMPEVCRFLGIARPDVAPPVVGFIKWNRSWIEAQQETAGELRRIYQDYPYFQLADTFKEWAPQFIELPRTQELLAKFTRFWNSTSHTNFDWIGPVGDDLMDELLRFAPSSARKNLNFAFYHEYFTLNSDHHDSPATARLEHFLGCLEEEILIPKLPYYIKIAIDYLVSVSKNNIKLRHSYLPLRAGSIYRRLARPEYQTKIGQYGLRTRMTEMETCLTEAEITCVTSLGEAKPIRTATEVRCLSE